MWCQIIDQLFLKLLKCEAKECKHAICGDSYDRVLHIWSKKMVIVGATKGQHAICGVKNEK